MCVLTGGGARDNDVGDAIDLHGEERGGRELVNPHWLHGRWVELGTRIRR
jgi:hypothetical protein